jgi:hypothetical protein
MNCLELGSFTQLNIFILNCIGFVYNISVWIINQGGFADVTVT